MNHWQIKGLISFPFICVSYATGGNKGKAHFFCIRRIWCALIMATTHITLNKLEHTFFFLSSQFAENIIAVMSCNRRIRLIPELCQTSVNFQVLIWDFTAAQVHSAVSHVLGAATVSLCCSSEMWSGRKNPNIKKFQLKLKETCHWIWSGPDQFPTEEIKCNKI